MTRCTDKALLLGALLDHELDAVNVIEIEAHLAVCPACAAAYADLRATRALLRDAGLRLSAPAAIRARISDAADTPRTRAVSPLAWMGTGAAGMLAACLGLFVLVSPMSTSLVQDEIIASHVRSLMPGRLIDIATSDRHVVKPWFNGKIDFAPPVVDLKAQGFPLVGGRIDYVGGRPVAALAYRHGRHVINLFVRPAMGASLWPDLESHQIGYTLIRWRQGDLEFWSISDIAPIDLARFHRVFSAATA